MSDATIAKRATVRGVVQGVGYRWNAARAAGDLGVVGWARNEADGTVTVWAQGGDGAVERFLAWCAEGPRHARVEGVDAEDVEPDRGLGGFDTA